MHAYDSEYCENCFAKLSQRTPEPIKAESVRKPLTDTEQIVLIVFLTFFFSLIIAIIYISYTTSLFRSFYP